jgi:hypothetical protein
MSAMGVSFHSLKSQFSGVKKQMLEGQKWRNALQYKGLKHLGLENIKNGTDSKNAVFSFKKEQNKHTGATTQCSTFNF